MRLTVDLILQSPQYISPAKNWTLSLRGCQVDVIENLGATGDYFECIDLSDNEIIKLSNFPPLPRLTSLILCNNRVARIDADLCENVPNLVSLVLTNNRIERLTDLLPLFKAKKLQRLTPPRQPPQSADSTAAEQPKESSRLRPEQLDAIKKAIAKASTLQEINRLESALASGVMPEGIEVGPGNTSMETDGDAGKQ
ncbi:hypothetical protein Emed_004095 [Eimeria media]